MSVRSLRSAASLALLVLAPLPAFSAAKSAATPATAHADTAIFAGGCFWCMETQFESFPGVLSVVSGYTGGHTANPTYEQVSSHTTGHLESVRVAFDPAVTNYKALLERFWYGIDPTQSNGQFCDEGSPYGTAIFYRNDAQKRAALDSRDALKRSGRLNKPIVTEIRAASAFWPAEDYHQDFWKKEPDHYRAYRQGCGRDSWLEKLWGAKAVKPLVH